MIFAYATDRILVMPPKQPFYLVGKEGSKNYDDFFHFEDEEFKKHITIISMEEFIAEHAEGGESSALKVSMNDWGNKTGHSPDKLRTSAAECGKLHKAKEGECDVLNKYMRDAAYVLPWHGSKDCVVFGEEVDPTSQQVKDFCVDRQVRTYVGRASEASETVRTPVGPPVDLRTPHRGHHMDEIRLFEVCQNDVSIFGRRAKLLETMTKRCRMVLCFAGRKERTCLLSCFIIKGR